MTIQYKNSAFDYTNTSDLEDYLVDNVGDVYRSCTRLLRIQKHIRKKIDGEMFHQLVEFDSSQPLLGGTAQSTDPAVSEFYRELFGIQFADPSKAYEKLVNQEPIDVPVVVKSTNIEDYLAHVADRCESILKKAEGVTIKDFQKNEEEMSDSIIHQFLSDSDFARKQIIQHLHAVQRVLPNYSKWALFIWSINWTPLRFLFRTYPGIKKDSTGQSILEKLGAVKETCSLSNSSEPVKFGKYRSDSLGSVLINLYLYLWTAFDNGDADGVRKFINEVPNYCTEFIQHAAERLNDSGHEFSEKEKQFYQTRTGNDREFTESLSIGTAPKTVTGQLKKATNQSLSDAIERQAPVLFYYTGLTVTLSLSSDEVRLISL